MQNEIAFDEKRYRRKVLWAVVAILTFVLVYILLVCAAVAITILVAYFGWKLVASYPHWLTIALVLVGMAFGLFMLYILLRFLAESSEMDESGLLPVTARDEPRLYQLIAETAAAAGCKMPKDVFLSGEVNASISFPASVLGLVLPLRKRLTMGLGLLETLSVTELKAVLAHEFGHFSQKSIRLGGYVYQVNRILHSVLVQRESDAALVERLKNAPWILSVLGLGASVAFHSVRWVLGKVYALVNLAHLSLSREMEFHADMVAAQITGSEALSRSLMRLHLSAHAQNLLYQFYDSKIPDGIKTANLFPQLSSLVRFLGEEEKMQIVAGLPQVPVEALAKYNRSKLVFHNQWESHPSTDDRIRAMAKFPPALGQNDASPAMTLLDQATRWQEAATTKVFQHAQYDKPITLYATEDFVAAIKAQHAEASFDPIYNGYYDDKIPLDFSVEQVAAAPVAAFPLEALFSDAVVEHQYEMFALNDDLDMLRRIVLPKSGVKTFDYDGKRYGHKDAATLIVELSVVEKAAIEKCRENDVRIFQTALVGARRLGQEEAIKSTYVEFFAMLKDVEESQEILRNLQESMGFLSETLQVDVIQARMKELKKREVSFLQRLRYMRTASEYAFLIDEAMSKDLDDYLVRDQRYFLAGAYEEAPIRLLYAAIGHFKTLLYKHSSTMRKALIRSQVQYLQASGGQTEGE